MGAGEEWPVPDLDHDPQRLPLLARDLGGHLPGQPRDLPAYLIPVGDVALEGDLPATRSRHVGLGDDRCGAEPAGGLNQPRPGHRAEVRRQFARVGAGQVRDGVDAQGGEPPGRSGADAPQHVGGAVAEHVVPGFMGEPEEAGRLAEPGGQLGLELVFADADRAFEVGHCADAVLDLAGERFRIVGFGGEEGLVPAGHLDDRVELAQRRHHHRRRGLVRFAVHGQEHRIGTALAGGTQGEARAHPEGACLIRRRADHATFGRVTITPHHHRAPAQLRVAQHLDRGDELVEVHVQHPAGHASVSLPGRALPATGTRRGYPGADMGMRE